MDDIRQRSGSVGKYTKNARIFSNKGSDGKKRISGGKEMGSQIPVDRCG